MNLNVSQMHEYQGQENQDRSQPNFCIEWMYKHTFTSIQAHCFGGSFDLTVPHARPGLHSVTAEKMSRV